jgi:hypothetical protein
MDMRIHRSTLFTVACLTAFLLTPPTLRAQSRNEAAVRAVVDSFFTAVAREQWDSAAMLIDLHAFEPFFRQQVSFSRAQLPQRDPTIDEIMARDSTMPRAVAEWEIAQMKKARAGREFGDYSYEFAGITTQHALLTMTVPDAAARWLAAQDRRTQMRESWRRQGCSLSVLPSAFGAVEHTVLAIAVANDSTAYVVHSDELLASSRADLMENERTFTVHRTAGGPWRILPRRDLLRRTNVSFFSSCPKH